MDEKTKNQVKEIIESVMELNLDDFEENKVIAEISQWDSFNNLMLISKFEEDLGITFSASDIEEIITLQDLYDFIDENL